MAKKELLNVNNYKCLLVDFVNESNKIQIAFECWLLDEDKNNIKSIIENQKIIIINWPNTDIIEAGVIKSRLKYVSWSKQPVKVLSSGEWTDLRMQMKRLEITDEDHTVSKKGRAIYKKICYSPSSDDNQDRREIMQDKEISLPSCSNLTSKNINLIEKAENNALSSLHLNYTDELSDTDVEDITLNLSDTSEASTTSFTYKLNAKRKNYEIDSCPKRAKVKNIEKVSKKQDFLEIKKESELSVLQQELKNCKTELQVYKDLISNIYCDITKINSITGKKLNYKKDAKAHFTALEGLNLENNENKENPPQLSSNLNDSDDENKSKRKTAIKKSLSEKVKEKKDEFEITKEITSNCNKESISSYTHDLMVKIFSKSELATCSANGLPCNANKNRNLLPKPAINQSKLQAIKGHVTNRFMHKINAKDLKKGINAAVRQTLNEYSKLKKLQDQTQY